MVLYILIAILIFGLLIVTHELGHFLTAKACGVRVNEFSVCMGPVLFQRKMGETVYSLRCIPIGGFCAMEGEDGESKDPRSFTAAPVWKRFLILVAGSAFNFLGALLILSVLFGMASRVSTPRIAGFFAGSSVSEETGLQIGDVITEIDGERVYQFSDVGTLLDREPTGIHDFRVLRNGQTLCLAQKPLKLKTYDINGTTVVRYGLYFAVEDMTPGRALSASWGCALNFGRMVRLGLTDLLRGAVGIDQMSGPVGIVSVMAETGQAAQSAGDAALDLAYFAAFLAVNLAIMNLLPLPALDGGRVLVLLLSFLYTGISGRKPNQKLEGYFHGVGMFLLLCFMAFITVKDILKFF